MRLVHHHDNAALGMLVCLVVLLAIAGFAAVGFGHAIGAWG